MPTFVFRVMKLSSYKFRRSRRAWQFNTSNQANPNQNAFIERFNRTLRNELLDAHLFMRLEDVREAVSGGRSNTTSSVPMTP